MQNQSVNTVYPSPVTQLGEEIVVYGDGVNRPDGAMSVGEVADLCGTIVDEVLTNISARV